jgi:hypothetical protein
MAVRKMKRKSSLRRDRVECLETGCAALLAWMVGIAPKMVRGWE